MNFGKTNTVKSLFVAAATIEIDDFLAQNLLSKNYVLLRLLFKGGYYLRAATNKDFTVYTLLHYCSSSSFQSKILSFVSCNADIAV